ncbi:MAG: 50S ribosomal protein L25, partial [Gammaproteobacteria bacterium]|nr:50S ribosomal protein L25 [Gammaproteobacteria bacterium]
RLQSGVISKNLTEIEVSCLPIHLPEFIPIDLENVELGTTIHLTDLELPEGVSIVSLTHGDMHDVLVVSVHLPRGGAVEEEEEEETEAEEDIVEEDEPTPDEDES